MSSARLLLAVVLTAFLSVVAPGSPAWSQMTSGQRTEVSDEMMRSISRNGTLLVRSLQLQRAQRILDRLLTATQRRDVGYRVALLDSGDVNAYALPDGRVVLTTGLVNRLPVNDNAPLAFALAHELSHVEKRHAERTMAQETTARAILGVLTRGSDEWVQVLGALSRELLLSGHSRGMEGEADLGGLELMSRAGYDPNGALVTLRVLQSLEGKGLRVFPTHPRAGDRYNRCAAWMNERGMGMRESARPKPPSAAGRPRARAGFGDTPSTRVEVPHRRDRDDSRDWGDGGDGHMMGPLSSPGR